MPENNPGPNPQEKRGPAPGTDSKHGETSKGGDDRKPDGNQDKR